MRSEITNKALNIIKGRHDLAKNRAEKNLNKALKNKDIKKSYFTCKNYIYEIAKLESKQQDASALNIKLKQEKIILAKLLNENKINLIDLKPNYSCKICNDFGFINGSECACLKKLKSQMLLENSNINSKDLPSFKDADFNLIKNEKIKQRTIKTFEKLKTWSEKLNSTKYNCITLYGKTGVGKTYLMNCTMLNAIENGYDTLYTTAFNLNQTMLKYHLAKLDEKQNIFADYLNCDLLCIDDLGTENIFNNVTIEYLYLILNERLVNHKFTLITTNLFPDQIQSIYGDRIFSRLINKFSSLSFNMEGSDLRLNIDDTDNL